MISFMMYATRNTKGTRVQKTHLLFGNSSNVVDTTAKLFKQKGKELFQKLLPGGDKYKLACFAC